MPNEIEFVYLNSRELYKGIDSLVEAKNKAIKAMTNTDLSSADETVRVGRKHRKEIMHSPTSSTNSCSLFSDSDNDDLPYNKSKLSTTARINSEHLSDRSSSPTVLKVPVAVINDTKREPRSMKQWSSKQKESSKRSIEYNSEPLLKKKPPSKDTPAHMRSSGSQQQCGSSFSKINVKNNKQAVVRELFYSSNKPDELCVSHSNSSDKGKKYDVEHPGSTHNVVTEDTSQHYSNTMNSQKQVLRMLTYLTSEVRYLESGQVEILKNIENAADNNYSNSETLTESLFNDLTDCPLPIDNITDLNTLEDKISGDKNFRNILVNELSCTGGKNLRLMVKRIMNKLFADELMSQFSFTGKKGKNKFNNLFVCAVIFDSIKKSNKLCKAASIDQIEERIKYNLAQAPFNKKNK